MSPSDDDLLRAYASDGAQAAFATLVERHLNLVYSAARRQVRSPQLAEEVAQSVFLDLARNATHVKPGTPLAAWLHVVTRRTAIDIVRRESRRQAREHQAAALAHRESEESTMKPNSPEWTAIEPLLDEAVESLNATDRSAILLRYFQNKSLRDIGAALGTSDDAAQKRVTRAVEQLRAFFLRRGVALTAAGLTTDLSAHALQAAPAGLGATIATTTAALSNVAGPAAAFEATKTIAMTTLQKYLIAATSALVVGAGLYETALFAHQRVELDALQHETADLSAQLRRTNQQSSVTSRQLDAARDEFASLQSANAAPFSDPAAEAEMRAWLARVDQLKQFAQQSGKAIPELALLSEQDWLNATKNMDHDYGRGGPEERIDEALRSLRGLAAIRFGMSLATASQAYVKVHDGQLPVDTRELAPYFKDNTYFKASAVDDAMLDRYAMRYTGALNDVPPAERSAVFVETTSPDEEHDQRSIVGPGGGRIRNFSDLHEDTSTALQAFAKANAGAAPVNAADLLPYFKPPLSPARQTKFIQTSSSLLPH